MQKLKEEEEERKNTDQRSNINKQTHYCRQSYNIYTFNKQGGLHEKNKTRNRNSAKNDVKSRENMER